MKISENFSRSEFSCKCGCGFETVDVELVMVHEFLRKHVAELLQEEVYTIITSGCRCKKHNKRIGGARKSKHTEGNAADFKIFTKKDNKLVDPNLIYKVLDTFFPDKFGIGLYSNRIHLDTRSKKARWDSSK
jgi:uncharacterized protein YcbK (DUF882 family)